MQASDAQRKYFFKLCMMLGYDPEEVKEKAKAKYGVAHFIELDKWQLSMLIDPLVKKLEKDKKYVEKYSSYKSTE